MLEITYDVPSNAGKRVTSKQCMCAQQAIKKISLLIGLNDAVRYDVTYTPAFCHTSYNFRWSDKWTINTSTLSKNKAFKTLCTGEV